METGTLMVELVLNLLMTATLMSVSLSKLLINRRRVQALRTRKQLHQVQHFSILHRKRWNLTVMMNLLGLGS